MSTPELLAAFEGAASAAAEAETQIRKRAAEAILAGERARIQAFRRLRLLRLLATAATGCESEADAVAAQAREVAAELGLDATRDAEREIVERLAPAGRLVWRCARGEGEAAPASVAAALGEFERWFEASRGRSFDSLFERHRVETPVVDF